MEWMSSLNITTEVLRARVPVTVIHLEGRINISTINLLVQAAQKAYESGSRHFLMDLKEVPSLTSAGLQGILTVYKMVNQSSSNEAGNPSQSLPTDAASKSPYLKMLNSSPDILKVLRIAGFESYIDIYDDLQKALSDF